MRQPTALTVSVHLPGAPDAPASAAGMRRCQESTSAAGGGLGVDVRARLEILVRRPSVATATTVKVWRPGLIQLVTR